MADDRSRRPLPPYVSYRTFNNFIEWLQEGIPSRIDRSYWGDRLSGSSGTQLMAALRFLRLVDNNGVPTQRLRELVPAKGSAKATLLRQITNEAFGLVLQGSFDPAEATYSQLEESFHNTYQATGDVLRKCLKFFISLTYAAEIPLSPFIMKRAKRARVGSAAGTKKAVRKDSLRTNQNYHVPQTMDEIPEQMSWGKMVLTKFPAFDPAWSDEIKLKWFEAFDRLLERRVPESNK